MNVVSTGTQFCDKCGKPLGVLRVATWYGTFHQECAGFSAASTDPRDDRIAELEAALRAIIGLGVTSDPAEDAKAMRGIARTALGLPQPWGFKGAAVKEDHGNE